LNATIKETLNYIQGFSGKIALVVSLAVAGFLMMSENTECLHAQAICQVGSDPTFTQPIKITGTGTNTATLSAANVTANRTITLPDVDGALLAGTLTNDAPFIAVSSTGALDSSQTLTASTPLKSNALGQITAADLVPETDLTVGSGLANQVLSIDGAGTALVFRNETSPSYTANAPYIKVDGAGAADTSSTLTANSPCLKADASGQIEACPSLTNSTPLKASATGQIEASDLDITTDITAGAALQQIRTNAAGNALEYFTPSASGGRWTLVANGTAEFDNAYGDGTAIVCWYDDTQGSGLGGSVDQTKTYKLIVQREGNPWYAPSNLPVGVYPKANWKVDSSCNTGSVSAYGGSNTAGGGAFTTAGWHSSTSAYYYNSQLFPYQQGTQNNGASNGSQCANANIEIIFKNGTYITTSNTSNDGIAYNYTSNARCYQSGTPSSGQWQTGGGLAIMNSGDTSGENFDDVTGMYFKHYSENQSFTRPQWFLFEAAN